MGVEFDRLLDPFTGPFEPVTDWNVRMPAGRVLRASGATGFVTDRRVNNAAVAVNRLLAAGEAVYWLHGAGGAGAETRGGFYVRSRPANAALLEKIAADQGVVFEGVPGPAPAAAAAWRISRPRIGLWDQYGGSMDSGWARWILEQFEFPFERVFAQRLDAGDLNTAFDALVFVEGGIPAGGGGSGRSGAAPANVPAEYQSHLGRVTAEKTLPTLRQFVANGGTIVAIGDSAMNLARHFSLPIENHLVEDGKEIPRNKYFVPGSLLALQVDVAQPVAHGMSAKTTAFFDNSPVFRLGADAAARGVTKIAWFEGQAPLRSGWAWGQHYLDGGVAAVEVKVGKGRVLLYGPEILKRAQPHGTFKLLFNALFLSAARP
jgi:hypothetical protein